MIELKNITSEPIQRHIILFQDSEIFLTLRFCPTIEEWFFNVEYKDFALYGVKLSLGTLHMLSSCKPFDFLVKDTSNTGLDPFRINDFSSGRCILYMLEADDMTILRGANVQI